MAKDRQRYKPCVARSNPMVATLVGDRSRQVNGIIWVGSTFSLEGMGLGDERALELGNNRGGQNRGGVAQVIEKRAAHQGHTKGNDAIPGFL